MISEVTLAREFASFWRAATPNIDGLVRRINRGMYKRDFQPIHSVTEPSRRALINELSFEIVCEIVVDLSEHRKRKSYLEYVERSLPKVRALAKVLRWEGDYESILLKEELEELRSQIIRLCRWMRDNRDRVLVIMRPNFFGCGIVDRCEGDMMIGNMLVEIKAGERAFRAIDLRQIIVYLTLNQQKPNWVIEDICIFNPRMGVSVTMSCDDLCFEVSGRHNADLLNLIAYGISSGDVSR